VSTSGGKPGRRLGQNRLESVFGLCRSGEWFFAKVVVMVSGVKRQQLTRGRRVHRVRNAIRRNSTRQYRLSVFRSNRNIYAQLIDDKAGVTVGSVSSLQAGVTPGLGSNIDAARSVGAKIGEIAMQLNISEASLDRGPYKYHGRVAALADAAREAGLNL
jgi:large subunit ribosomal protein L18